MRFLFFSAALCGAIVSAASLPTLAETEQTPAVEIPSYSSAEIEAAYIQRFQDFVAAVQRGASTAVYDIMAPVPGAPDYQPLPRGEAKGISAETLAAMDDYAAANNSQALMVYQDGRIVFERYYGDTDAATPIVSKSLAKPLGVIAVARAIAEGDIESLDEPIVHYIEPWSVDDRRDIEVRHILDMRSGLLPQGFSFDPQDVINRAYLHPLHDQVIIHDYPLTHPPGSRYEYSNANSELVAPLIELATEVQYEDWVAEQVLQPLGAAGGEVWMNREGGTAHAGCCILLPAESYLRLAVLLLNDGVWEGERLLPEGFVKEMRTATPQNPYAGIGVFLGKEHLESRPIGHPEGDFTRVFHGEPYLDRDIYLFDGNHNQVAYIMPNQNMVILRVGNRPPRDPGWDNAILPNLVLRDLAEAR